MLYLIFSLLTQLSFFPVGQGPGRGVLRGAVPRQPPLRGAGPAPRVGEGRRHHGRALQAIREGHGQWNETERL